MCLVVLHLLCHLLVCMLVDLLMLTGVSVLVDISVRVDISVLTILLSIRMSLDSFFVVP